MKLRQKLKNKKILSLLLVATIGCSMIGCSKDVEDSSIVSDNSIDLTNYFDTNEFDSSKLNKNSKDNYEKITNIQSMLKDEYGNPDKTPDYLESLSVYVNEDLNLGDIKFDVVPVTWFNHFENMEESEYSKYIIEYIKDTIKSNSANLSSFMDKGYTSHIVVDYDMPMSGSGAFPYYPVDCNFGYTRLDGNDYVEIINYPINDDDKLIQLYYKVENNELVEINDDELIDKIEKVNLDFYDVEEFWAKLTINTEKEGDFKNIAGTKYSYSKETNNTDGYDYELAEMGVIDSNEVNLKIYPVEYLSELLGKEDVVLDNKEVQNFIKNIENIIDDNFAFLKYKNVLEFYQIGPVGIQSLPEVFIKTNGSGKKTYARIDSLTDAVIEENKIFEK